MKSITLKGWIKSETIYFKKALMVEIKEVNNKVSSNKITITNIVSTLLVQGISFFSAPIFSRMLGTNNYGILSVYTTWVGVASSVFTLQTTSTLGAARVRFSNDEQDKYQSSVWSLSLFGFLLFSAIVLLLRNPISELIQLEPLLVCLLLVQSISASGMAFANNKYVLEFKAKNNLILSIYFALANIGFSLVMMPLFNSNNNYYARIIGLIIPQLLFTVLFTVLLLRSGRMIYNKEYWKFCLPIALPLILHSLSGTILNHSDRIVMQMLLNSTEVGIYSLAFSFASVLSSLYISLNNSFIPFYISYVKEDNLSDLDIRATRYTELYTAICSGFVLLSPEVYHLFASRDYWRGTNYIPLFTIGIYFVFLYSFSVNYETFVGKTYIIAVATVISAIINIVLNFILLRLFGALGVVLATLLSDVVLFVVHYIFTMRIANNRKHPVPLSTKIVYIIPFCILATMCFCVGTKLVMIRWLAGGLIGMWELFRIISRKHIF